MDSIRGRAEVLRAQIDSMRRDLVERARSLESAQEQIADATARVRSTDGTVEIVVDSSGSIVGVHLSPGAYVKHSPGALGKLILATATSATADMRRQVAEIVDPFTEAARADAPGLVELTDGG